MRETDRAGTALARLLPRAIREDLFEPADADLRIAHLRRIQAVTGSVARTLHRGRFRLLRVLLLLSCWRIVPAEALARWRDHRLHTRRAPRPRKEGLPVLLYTLRHAVRLLLRERAFTAAAVLTLALGVGANSAIFAVVEAVLLRPLPYAAADDLMILTHRDVRTGLTKEFIAIGDFVDLRARQEVFETLTSYDGFEMTMTGTGEPHRVSVLRAGPGLLDTLRVTALRGRAFTEIDAREGAPRVAMLGYDLWQSRFAGDEAVIGRTIRLGTADRQIVGIAPRGFRFPAGARTEVIIPAGVPAQAPAQRKAGWVFAMGRLKPGVTRVDAAVALTTLSRQMEVEHPESNEGSLYFPVPLRDALLGDTKQPLILMLAAVGVVLLIACANVGNLLLARGLARRQEMALRIALGAGRARLLGQLAVESLVLTTLAGVVGLAVAYWGAPALVALVPESVDVPGLASVGINGGVLAFAAGLCGLAALVFSLLSAATIRRERGGTALVAQTRITAGAAVRRATSGLVVAEVALAVVLLIGAGLILRSFAQLLAVDPGFQVERIAVVNTVLPSDRYQRVEARQAFYARAFQALRAVPGVEAAGAGIVVPLTGNNWTGPFERADRPVPAGQRPPDVGWQSASGGYFEALRIPLLSGRLFDARDAAGPPVLIISRAVERQFFPDRPAVGQRVRLGANETAEIVGVVGDVRRAALADTPRPDMYFPFEFAPSPSATLFVRTSGNPVEALASIQATLKVVEAGIVVPETRTMAAVAARSIATTRLALWLLGIFGAVAVALAGVGIYGVMSYLVRQRAREIGTRMALGASRRDILWLVMRQGTVIAAAGVVMGLLAGLVLARSLASILYDVSPSDPVAVTAAVAVLGLVTMAACYVPARRATRVDPARTLAE
jgi:predicted permease